MEESRTESVSLGTTEHQYGAGFEEWWETTGGSGDYAKAFAKAAWSAGALRMEKIKDAAYSQLRAQRDREMVAHNHAARARMEVHRDDYARAGVLIAGLTRIEELGGEAAKIATTTLTEALQKWETRRAETDS